jgi:L-ascorbate metabolism protein UlaG (beta-lactamase superfamily)
MRLYLIVFYFIGSLDALFSQVLPNNLQIINVANEGFLLSTSTHKVLIDALFTNGYGAFSVPPKDFTDKIMKSEAPFDSVHLYLLTHYHADHCDPVLINQYLSKHPDIPFVASKPSIVFIDGTCFGFIAKKKQFRVMTPEMNQSITKTLNNIPVKVFGLKHLSFYKDSIDLEETMFHVSYLLDMDGIKIFHSGDIEKNAFEDYLAKNKSWTDTIDVAFLYYKLFVSNESDLDYMVQTLHPKIIVAMHVPPKHNEEVWAKIEKLKSRFPNILYFKNSMDSQLITVRK